MATYADTRRFVAHTCELDALAWSATVALPKGISDSQRQEALAWLQQIQAQHREDRPRVRPRKRT